MHPASRALRPDPQVRVAAEAVTEARVFADRDVDPCLAAVSLYSRRDAARVECLGHLLESRPYDIGQAGGGSLTEALLGRRLSGRLAASLRHACSVVGEDGVKLLLDVLGHAARNSPGCFVIMVRPPTGAGKNPCAVRDTRSTVRASNPFSREIRLSESLRGLIFGAALCLCACGSTTFLSTWKAPDAQPVSASGKSIAALVISGDKTRQRDAEVYLSNDLTTRGARGVPAHQLIGYGHPDVDYALAKFRQAGVEGVVVMRLVGHHQTVMVDPGGFSGEAYTSFGSYYQSTGVSLSYSSGSVQIDTEVTVETLVYSLTQNKLLWAGTSRTSNPAGVQSLINEVADAVSSEMGRDGLIAR